MKLLSLINCIRSHRLFLAYLYLLLTVYAPAELTRLIVNQMPLAELRPDYRIIQLGVGYVGLEPLEMTSPTTEMWVFFLEIALVWIGYLIALFWFIKAVKK